MKKKITKIEEKNTRRWHWKLVINTKVEKSSLNKGE